MSFRNVQCRSLITEDLQVNNLKIKVAKNVSPLEVINEKGDVIFDINAMGELFHKDQAQSFLNLSDTPKSYTNGILKIKDSQIVIEPELEPEPQPKPEPEPEINNFKHVNCKILNAMSLEALDASITKLTSKQIETENIKTDSIDIKNLKTDLIDSDEIKTNHLFGNLAELDVINGLHITTGLVNADSIIANTIENDKFMCKELHCDNIISTMLDINEIQHGSVEEPLCLALTQQKSIDYESCDTFVIYTKVPVGVTKQSFKILAVPNDKFLHIKGITAIGHDLQFTYNLSLVDTEYIVSINYKTKVSHDEIILRILI